MPSVPAAAGQREPQPRGKCGCGSLCFHRGPGGNALLLSLLIFRPCGQEFVLQLLLEMGSNERLVLAFELAQHRRRGAELPGVGGHGAARRVDERERARRQRQIRRIDALQPQQPALEIPGQRLGRRATDQRLERRRAQPEQTLVGVRVGGPLVDQLRKVVAVTERLWTRGHQRRPHRLGIIQAHQLAPLLLEVRHAHFGERLERGAEPLARLARVRRDTAFLTAIARQEHDDAIGFEPIHIDAVSQQTEWRPVKRPILDDEPGTCVIAQLDALDAQRRGDAAAQAFDRDPAEYASAPLVELRLVPDWARTIARHWLYETADAIRIEALKGAEDPEVAALAEKIDREEAYHRMHAQMWEERLREEPRFREAVDELWLYAAALLPAGQRPALADRVGRELPSNSLLLAHERGQHSDDLPPLWEEMTMVRRSVPGAAW